MAKNWSANALAERKGLAFSRFWWQEPAAGPHFHFMPKLIIHNPDGTTVKYGLNGRNFTVGRAENNDIVLPGGSSSNHHAVLKQQDTGDFSVTDLDSTNHTRINGQKVQTSVLRNGDSILFGDIRADYESEFSPPSAAPPAVDAGGSPRPPSHVVIPDAPPRAPMPNAPAGPRQPYMMARPGAPSGQMGAADGCFALVLFLLVGGLAFFGGMWGRHYQDHKQSLPAWIKDVMAAHQAPKQTPPQSTSQAGAAKPAATPQKP